LTSARRSSVCEGASRHRRELIAAPLPPEQAQQARKRKHRKARKRGRRPASSTRVLAGWLLVLTTLARGHWTRAGLRVWLSRLQRFRWASPRRRKQQEAHGRAWLGTRDQPEWLAMAA
jgi:hypothetical protein